MNERDKFPYPTLTKDGFRKLVETYRADNVKVVYHPDLGRVYVCPFPPEHFPELVEDARRIRIRKKIKKFI